MPLGAALTVAAVAADADGPLNTFQLVIGGQQAEGETGDLRSRKKI